VGVLLKTCLLEVSAEEYCLACLCTKRHLFDYCLTGDLFALRLNWLAGLPLKRGPPSLKRGNVIQNMRTVSKRHQTSGGPPFLYERAAYWQCPLQLERRTSSSTQMESTPHFCAGHRLLSSGGLLDRFVAGLHLLDTTTQGPCGLLRQVLPDTAWNLGLHIAKV
jgi:hypothetical protein